MTLKILGRPPVEPVMIFSWMGLHDYVPDPEHDVRFEYGDFYNWGNADWFEQEWRAKGMTGLVEVCDVYRDPIDHTDTNFRDPTPFLVARFATPGEALFFRLSIP